MPFIGIVCSLQSLGRLHAYPDANRDAYRDAEPQEPAAAAVLSSQLPPCRVSSLVVKKWHSFRVQDKRYNQENKNRYSFQVQYKR